MSFSEKHNWNPTTLDLSMLGFEEYDTDVLVIGSGAAGLRASIAAGEEGRKVLLLSKCTAGLATSTILSYGAFGSSGFGLSIEEHIQKTIETGHGSNNPILVKILSEEAPTRIWELRRKGVRFKENKHGVVVDSKPPIMGKQIVNVLLKWAKDANVRIMNWVTTIKLIDKDGSIIGCLAITEKGKPVIIWTKATVLCTGGASGIYKFHDNPATSTGDGYALAYRCGAEIKDMEFIQFYPMAIKANHLPKMIVPPFLAERGNIVNIVGEDILIKYGLSDVRPIAIKGRDKLSIAIFQEIRGGREVFLDIRNLSKEEFKNSFEHDFVDLLEFKYKSNERLLPISPCAHFTIGGAVIDENCKTSINGLFAAGEVACGVHGANRMGGNALTETLVFGYRAGSAASSFSGENRLKKIEGVKVKNLLHSLPTFEKGKYSPSEMLMHLQDIMWEHCGPIRDERGLLSARDKIEKLKEEGIHCDKPESLAFSFSVFNSLDTAGIIIESSIARKENVGAYYKVV